MDIIAELTMRMAKFNQGRPDLTQHLLKVHAFARTIGVLEGLDADTLLTLELAALTHDIGIKPCLDKYGKCTGKMQEEEGPPFARAMLEALSVAADRTDRICYLIAHHHTYTNVEGLDLRILLEADFLVNLFEGKQDASAQQSALQNIFHTESGKRMFHHLYPPA